MLLVESTDIALMNKQKMLDAIRGAYPEALPIGVDRLWYADTVFPDDIDFDDLTPFLAGSAARSPS